MEKKLFRYSREIDRKNIRKADSYRELMDKMEARIKKKYSSSKVKWIWKIQQIHKNLDYNTLPNGNIESNYDELFKALKFTINSKANWLEKKYKYARLSFHDFEAELWKITYDAIDYYEQWGDIDTEFALLETLELFWENRMNDYIKSCLYTQKHSPWYKAASLAEDFEEFWPDDHLDIEKQVIDKETVFEMLNDNDLEEKERQLLFLIYDYPKGSYRQWGQEMGIISILKLLEDCCYHFKKSLRDIIRFKF